MCLIITGKADKIRDTLLGVPQLLEDIYTGNKDGIGSMYTSDDGLVVVNKIVPATLVEAQAFIQALPQSERDLALHFRMRTHGDIDLTNCHPYPVIEGQVHMMHNGVIHGINDKSDKTKSDTWHYIEQILKPQLIEAPKLLQIPAWLHLVGEDIGSNNRFVFLDKDGHLVIVNKRTGVEHDGMWFSNTYAWSPEMLIPDYRWTGYGMYGGWGDDDEVGYGAHWKRSYGNTPAPAPAPARAPTPAVSAEAVWDAVHDADADEVYKLLDQYPISTLMVLFKNDRFISSVGAEELSTQDAKVVRMLESADETTINRYCRKSAGRCRKVAEVIAWYGSWVAKEAPADEEVIESDSLTEHERFMNWMNRQGKNLTGTTTNPYPTSPAKWTAQTPALLAPPPLPAQVAPIKSRTIQYRGYRIEVPAGLLQADKSKELQDLLEQEVLQRMHNEDLALWIAQNSSTTTNETSHPPAGEAASELLGDKDEAHVDAANEAYAG